MRQNEYDWLNGKLKENGRIVSLMDNDNVGKKEAIWLKNNYHIIPFLIPSNYKAKDFAELVANNKFEDVSNLIINAIKYIKSYGERVQSIRNTIKRSDIMPF